MAEYKLSGDEKEIKKILQENRIRVERGLVTFTPCSTMEFDGKNILVIDDKSVPAEDEKKPKRPKKKKAE